MSMKLVEGRIFLGMQEEVSKPKENQIKQKASPLIYRLQGFLFAFFIISAIGLIVGAVLHRQWTGLPWVGMVWSPFLILLIAFFLRKRLRLPDEHTLSVIDWLTQQAKNDGLEALLTKGVKLVWLTQDGIYVFPKRFLPWSSFIKVSFEEAIIGREHRPTLRLKLLLRKPRTVTKRWVYAFISCFFLIGCFGVMMLYILFGRYGLRDDVLSLLFAVLSAFSLQFEIISRYNQQRRWAKFDLSVLFNHQKISFEDLRDFIVKCLPQGLILNQ